MKRALVIDDLRDFGEAWEGMPIDYARTSESGMEALKDWRKYDAIMLDHDLGEGDNAVRCGRRLEEISFEHPEARSIGVLIVSDNGPGRKELEGATRLFRRIGGMPRSKPIGSRAMNGIRKTGSSDRIRRPRATDDPAC